MYSLLHTCTSSPFIAHTREEEESRVSCVGRVLHCGWANFLHCWVIQVVVSLLKREPWFLFSAGRIIYEAACSFLLCAAWEIGRHCWGRSLWLAEYYIAEKYSPVLGRCHITPTNDRTTSNWIVLLLSIRVGNFGISYGCVLREDSSFYCTLYTHFWENGSLDISGRLFTDS